MSKEELKKLKEKVEDLQEELEELTDEELEQIFGGIETGVGSDTTDPVRKMNHTRILGE